MAIIKPNNNTISAITALPAAIPTGSLVKLSTITASSSTSISFDGLFTSDYKNYIVYLNNILPATDNVQPRVRYRQSNADMTATQYGVANVGIYRQDGTGDAVINGGQNEDYAAIAYNNGGSNVAQDFGFNGYIEIFNPLDTVGYKLMSGKINQVRADAAYFQTKIFIIRNEANTNALSGVSLFMSSGNITSGTATMYGIKS
tara:strand:- start:231 stop:836 length:606 start_codon:yes stop_codon:yes gene_type:complete